MEIFLDPSIWFGLLSLILLEIVLGIDNLVFIAILAGKLPPDQRDKARRLGLVLALLMRFALLSVMAWLVTLTQPWLYIGSFSFSGRDVILLVGGLFLLFKGTTEIHERLDGKRQAAQAGSVIRVSFAVVVAQIVALDAVFSLDSVITAVGMVDHLWVMLTAVTIAMGVMLWASKWLTQFVNERPTIIILCLGFLMMIGFSLMAEGLGFDMPKGYLYAAIGFSIMIEALNQIARFNRKKHIEKRPLRERTADAVLRLLGDKSSAHSVADEEDVVNSEALLEQAFKQQERQMIRGVLRLADAPIQIHMTPRPDIAWVGDEASSKDILALLQNKPHSRFLVCKDNDLDQWLGVTQSRALLIRILEDQTLNLPETLEQPLVVLEGASSLNVLESLRQHPVPMAVVVDEYGSVQGLVTTADLLAAIAGELFDTVDAEHLPQQREDGTWQLDGGFPLEQLSDLLDKDFTHKDYYTLAGLVQAHLQSIPEEGEAFDLLGYHFVVTETEGPRVVKVDVFAL